MYQCSIDGNIQDLGKMVLVKGLLLDLVGHYVEFV